MVLAESSLTVTAAAAPAAPAAERRVTVTFLLALVAFVSLGLPDAVQGVAWPSVRRTFDLPIDRLGVLLFCTVAGGLASSFFSGALVRRFGVGGILIVSSLLVAVSVTGYALAPLWPVMAASAVIAGLGSGAIDAGINTYAATRFHPSRIAWLHASWGIGAMLGPFVMTTVLTAALSWRVGYGVLAGVIGFLSLGFYRTRRQWDVTSAGDEPSEVQVPLSASLRRPLVWANAALFFVYTGVEATAGQWAYSLFTEGRGMEPYGAGLAVSVYWGSLTLSRVVSGVLVYRVAPATLLRAYVVFVPLGAAVVAAARGPAIDAAALALVGFALGPIFPMLVAGTPQRLGAAHAANGVGFQISAAGLGFASIPSISGYLARAQGIETIGLFLLAIATTMAVLHECVLRIEIGQASAAGRSAGTR